MTETIAAGCVCAAIFLLSHFWREWQLKKDQTKLIIYWERPLIALASLFVCAHLTKWNMEAYTQWLIVFYLGLLAIHVVYVHRKLNQSRRAEPKKDTPHEQNG